VLCSWHGFSSVLKSLNLVCMFMNFVTCRKRTCIIFQVLFLREESLFHHSCPVLSRIFSSSRPGFSCQTVVSRSEIGFLLKLAQYFRGWRPFLFGLGKVKRWRTLFLVRVHVFVSAAVQMDTMTPAALQASADQHAFAGDAAVAEVKAPYRITRRLLSFQSGLFFFSWWACSPLYALFGVIKA
jgi:hypothetical protein